MSEKPVMSSLSKRDIEIVDLANLDLSQYNVEEADSVKFDQFNNKGTKVTIKENKVSIIAKK